MKNLNATQWLLTLQRHWSMPWLQVAWLLQQCLVWRQWSHLHPLQSLLNASAPLITVKRKFDHITSIICEDLHWLPVRQLILYKLCTLVCKCLHRAALCYLIDLCIPASATTARSVYTFVITLWSDNSALSTVKLLITQLRCLQSCSVELSTSSHSRPVFIAILFLQPCQDWII